MAESTVTLNNGVEMPRLGYGTIGQTGEQIVENVAFALNNGYDLIDTANRYGNEEVVGRGLKLSGRPGESYFLETKLGPTLYSSQGAVEGAVKRLGVEYIDIMILHHPVNDYISGYRMLERACREGKIRAIGLSNFPQEKVDQVLAECDIPPAIMQEEGHPYSPSENAAFCREKGIAIQCWYPLGHGSQELLRDPVILGVGEKYGKTAAQIVLRWHIQMGFCPVPGSRSKGHIRENSEIFDFALSAEDMERIGSINRHEPFYKVTPESLKRLAETKCNFEE